MRIKYLSLAFLTATVFAQTPPTLDEINKLKIDNIAKDMQIAQMQKQVADKNVYDANSKMQQLVIEIETKYPGYTINFQTGSLITKPTAPDTKDPRTGLPINKPAPPNALPEQEKHKSKN